MVTNFHKKAWTKNAHNWHIYKPPLRPSVGELKVIEQYLLKLSKKRPIWQTRALILGATPEYRDLLARHKIKAVIVDYNENSVKSMSQLLRFRGLRKEEIVINNWLKMKFKNNSFDAVLADWSFNNLQKINDYSKLLSIVKKILKPNGIFVNRTNVYDSNAKARTVKQIMRSYQQNPKEKFSYLQEMQDYSKSSARNKRTFVSDLEKFYHGNLPLAHQRNEMSLIQLNEFTKKFTHGKWRIKLKLSILDRVKFEKLLRRHFKIVSISYGKDYLYSKHEPIYLVKPIK
jgi:ubiquinone/menaquinone biosynthesis C-methylase UbiE